MTRVLTQPRREFLADPGCPPVSPGLDPLGAILARFDAAGSALALVADGARLTDRDVAAAIEDTAARLGAGRRLVAIEGTNSLDNIVALLACMHAGHVALIAPPCHLQRLSEAWHADTVVTSEPSGRATIDIGTDRPATPLHADLAVLLSTSGSTGAPKLVRLSRRNIAANAQSIAAGLALCPADRAITSLSPAYCYGLSVLTSHLAAGASLVLTDRSVTDPAFWELARREGATTLAGVPHTFELLERSGFTGSQLPSLRLLTCAGGRLDPARARELALRGAAEGWGLSLMYGATEATARMAMLPPELTASHPGLVGRPVLGGEVRLIDPDADGVGTLAYRGPNVMMGYAEHPCDLGRGADLQEFVTSDRARIHDGAMIEIVGRVGSFAKVMGLRIDTDRVESVLAEAGWVPAVCEVDGRLGVLIEASSKTSLDGLGAAVHAATGLKPAALVLESVPALPRLTSGKVDRKAVLAALRATDGCVPVPESTRLAALVGGYSRLLARPAGPGDSFVSLGGDSMSYIVASLLVERTLGRLPGDWHRRTLADLSADWEANGRTEAHRPGGSSLLGSRQLEITVLVRALAVLAILASHASVVDVRGGAHLLMALVGLGLARFLLVPGDPARSARRVLRTSARILVPAVAWVALLAAISDSYSGAVIGTAWLSSPTTMSPDWRYWFVAALLWLLPLTALALRVPSVSSAVARFRFGAPAAATVLAWLAAAAFAPDTWPGSSFAPLAVAWVFLLGWAIGEARDHRHRLIATALVLALCGLTFEESRAWTVPLGLLLVIWLPRVRMPAALAAVVVPVAAASLAIYLLQWPVLDLLGSGWLPVLGSLAVGVAAHRLLSRALSQRWNMTARMRAPLSAVELRSAAAPS